MSLARNADVSRNVGEREKEETPVNHYAKVQLHCPHPASHGDVVADAVLMVRVAKSPVLATRAIWQWLARPSAARNRSLLVLRRRRENGVRRGVYRGREAIPDAGVPNLIVIETSWRKTSTPAVPLQWYREKNGSGRVAPVPLTTVYWAFSEDAIRSTVNAPKN